VDANAATSRMSATEGQLRSSCRKSASMRIYYFDLRDGDALVTDEAGVQLCDLRAAQDEAARGLAGVAWDSMRSERGEGHQVAIEVRDEQGLVLQLRFTFEITRIRPQPLIAGMVRIRARWRPNQGFFAHSQKRSKSSKSAPMPRETTGNLGN